MRIQRLLEITPADSAQLTVELGGGAAEFGGHALARELFAVVLGNIQRGVPAQGHDTGGVVPLGALDAVIYEKEDDLSQHCNLNS